MINNNVIITCVLMVVMGAVLPPALVIIWKIKTKQYMSTILIGAATFFVFAIILESIPKLLFFQANNPIGKNVLSDTRLFIGIAALLAGIFEETGRYVAFKYVLKKRTDRKTSISFGIGHGGFEAMYVLVMGGIQYLTYAMLINAGQFNSMIEQVRAVSPEQVPTMEAIPETLAAVTASTLVIMIIERISAVLIHISCSVIVFRAVREPGKLWLYPLAIFLHAFIDVFAGMYQTGVITNVYVIEAGLFVWSLTFFIAVYKLVYRKLPLEA